MALCYNWETLEIVNLVSYSAQIETELNTFPVLNYLFMYSKLKMLIAICIFTALSDYINLTKGQPKFKIKFPDNANRFIFPHLFCLLADFH